MLRYYKKALRELEEKSNGKYQVEERYHKQGLNNIYGGEVEEDSRVDLSKESQKSSTLERSRYSYEISPCGSSLQSNTHHSKKTSGKVSSKDGHKKKKKRTEDLTTNKVDLADGNYNKTDATESIVEPSFISNLTMDKAKLREATVNSNKIHENIQTF
ncbi:hypothetical protein OS493_036750 [Desmophyllum pertusum]|uniref:Uncharacterized protein n=1 Tax=Desmophyllum pertusum TaxID=174260 RepID=A0A9W9Z855_9CNID|nr:hypothetical protein OS493_036750 [Desmophyllum pertusum]